MISREHQLLDLKQKYCVADCSYKASICRIEKELRGYCCRCDGLFSGWRKKKDDKGKEYTIADFTGGRIMVENEKSCKWTFACSCRCGQQYPELDIFDANDDMCHYGRIQRRLLWQSEKLANRKSSELVKKYLDKYDFEEVR